MRQARETAFRDKSLLSKRYRQAKSSGDFGKAMEVAQQADKMGMPVGTTGSFDQLAQTGQRRYEQGMFAAGQQPEKTGLDAFDFRQASQRGAAGVGGYDFRQGAQRRAMQPAEDMAPTDPTGQKVPPVPLSTTVPGTGLSTPGQSRQPQIRNLTDQFRQMYKDAQDDTPESDQAQADIVAEAYAQGVPLSGLGMDILRKSQAAYTLPEPKEAVTPSLVERDAQGKPIKATDYGKRLMQSREELFMKQPAFAKRRMSQQSGSITRR